MTVGVAVMFQSNNRVGIVTASDRMLTALDIGVEYEHPLSKFATLTPSVMALVAGNIVVHSAVAKAAVEKIRIRKLTDTIEIAETYAAELRTYSRTKAEQYYLAPLNLTFDRLVSDKSGVDRAVFDDVYPKVTGYPFTDEMDVQTLVVGCTPTGTELCAIDNLGRVTLQTDIGFHAIGIGVSHAMGHLMQAGTQKNQDYYAALWAAYCAKRRAEIAPGVGKETDMVWLWDNRIERIANDIIADLKNQYQYNEDRRSADEQETVDYFWQKYSPPPPPPKPVQPATQETSNEKASGAIDVEQGSSESISSATEERADDGPDAAKGRPKKKRKDAQDDSDDKESGGKEEA